MASWRTRFGRTAPAKDHEGREIITPAEFERRIIEASQRTVGRGDWLCDLKVDGGVKLIGVELTGPIRLRNVIFQRGLNMKDARLAFLKFDKCKFDWLGLQRVVVSGSIIVKDCTVETGCNLRGAVVKQSVALTRSTVKFSTSPGQARPHRALDLRYATIGGNVYLRGGFQSEGAVDLTGVRIAGMLDCERAKLLAAKEDGTARPSALIAQHSRIDGPVYLNRGFEAYGEVDFRRAIMGASFSVREAKLSDRYPDTCLRERNSYVDRPTFALNLESATIANDLQLRDLFALRGDIGLQNATAKTFSDDPDSWLRAKNLDGRLWMQGFSYQIVTKPIDRGVARLKWLEKVLPDDYLESDQFKRQPWFQMAGVLRNMGYLEASDRIYRDSSDRISRRLLKLLKNNKFALIGYPAFVAFYWVVKRVFNFGYGLGYIKGIAFILMVAVVNMVAFAGLAAAGLMKPLESPVLVWIDGQDDDRSRDYTTPGYTKFNSAVYGLDILLPIELGQQTKWTPMTPHDRCLEPDSAADRRRCVDLGGEPLDFMSQVMRSVGERTQIAPGTTATNYLLRLAIFLKWLSGGFGWISVIAVGASAAGRFGIAAQR